MSAQPKTIDKFETGLVQYQPNQILNDDAFPILENAITYLHTVKRRKENQTVGRLKRDLVAAPLGNSVNGTWTINTLYSTLTSPITGEPNAAIKPGSVVITVSVSAVVFTDQGDGTLTGGAGGSTINYATGEIVLENAGGGVHPTTVTFSYYPGLASMAVFDRDVDDGSIENIFMDTKYSYKYTAPGFVEFPTGTVWDLSDSTFPSSLNYYVDKDNHKVFWVTNNQGSSATAIPIKYTNAQAGAVWYDFKPAVDGTNFLLQAKFILAFRGRMFAFNTVEGQLITTGVNYTNRVRCSWEGTPFTTGTTIITTVNADAWNDTIPGKGYFQDIPTNEPIVGVYLVMNQIIIKTSTKTWVLSQTGINIAPFKIDLLDDNEGTGSGFGFANMGSYISNIGTRTINNTSPTQVTAIDKKIINFVFNINRENNGLARVYGARDFLNRWNSFIYPYQPAGETAVKFPNRRLIQNYENNSWAINTDSLTCLGYFRENLSPAASYTWATANFSWETANFAWNQNSTQEPFVCGGNQQGYIFTIDSSITAGNSLQLNDVAYTSATSAAIFTSSDHNMADGQIVKISGVIGTYSYLNGLVGQVSVIDKDTFYIFQYNAASLLFDIPICVLTDMDYIGGGELSLRNNFFILTKAFNHLKEGQSIYVQYLDTLVDVYPSAYVQMLVFPSLNTSNPANLYPESNAVPGLFGNQISLSNPTTYNLSQVNNRALVNQRSNLLSFGFKLDDATMVSDNFNTEFLMSSITVWERPAGRPLMPFGGG